MIFWYPGELTAERRCKAGPSVQPQEPHEIARGDFRRGQILSVPATRVEIASFDHIVSAVRESSQKYFEVFLKARTARLSASSPGCGTRSGHAPGSHNGCKFPNHHENKLHFPKTGNPADPIFPGHALR